MKNRKQLPSLRRLDELFEYNELNGDLLFKPRKRSEFKTDRSCSAWHARFCGKKAGASTGDRYIRVTVDGSSYPAHNICWVLNGNDAPTGTHVIDHINYNKQDNRIRNLRMASYGENVHHRKPKVRADGTPKGVRYHKASRLWHSVITKDKKRTCLGYHKTKESAHQAYCEAAKRIYRGYATTT